MVNIHRYSYRRSGTFLLSLYPTTHYSILFLLYNPFSTKNPLPPSCSADPHTLKTQSTLFQEAWGENMKNQYSCCFEGELQREVCPHRNGKIPPRFMQRGFENKRGFLHQSSENEREKSLKGSDNEGLCPETPFWE